MVTDTTVIENEVIEEEKPEGETSESAKEEAPQEEPPQEEPPAYVPDYSYRANQEDREFPDHIKSLIQNKETEDYFRKLHAALDGIDPMKEKYEKRVEELETQYNSVYPEYEKITRGVQELKKYAQEGRVDVLAQVLGIPEDALVDYTSKMINASPEEKQYHQERTNLMLENQGYKEQLNQQRAESIKLMRQQHDFELQQALSDPTIQDVKATYEKLIGPESFKALVEREGDLHYTTSKRYLSPREAVMSAVHKARVMPFMNQPVQQEQPVQHQPTQTETAPPALPNMGSGRKVSPTRKRFNSIDSIKKHYQDKYGD